jgi:hypothetical protein
MFGLNHFEEILDFSCLTSDRRWPFSGFVRSSKNLAETSSAALPELELRRFVCREF